MLSQRHKKSRFVTKDTLYKASKAIQLPFTKAEPKTVIKWLKKSK